MIGIAADISISKHRRSINTIYEEINNIERYRRIIKNEGIYLFLQLDVIEECLQNSEFLSEFKEVICSSPDCVWILKIIIIAFLSFGERFNLY